LPATAATQHIAIFHIDEWKNFYPCCVTYTAKQAGDRNKMRYSDAFTII